MKIYKIAATEDQNKKKIEGLESDIKTMKKDIKGLESDMKKMAKDVDSLNVGNRQFWQQKTIYNSMERKLERLDKIVSEWKNFKEGMGDKIKREVEKGTRAQIGTLISPK